MSDADFIITGDDDLLVLKEYKSIKIITPKEYLEIIRVCL
jgi:predicted nucleic acid-binding protein